MYNLNVREEIFGATLFNLKTGVRDYINNDELKILVNSNKLPCDLDMCSSELNMKFVPLENKKIKHFSFADICYLEVTRDCNLNCIHCLNNSGKKLNQQLEFDELINIINEMSKCGIQEIRFTGGEPLVYDKIYDLIEFATERGIYTSIGTNGTLITEDVAKKLKKAGLKKAIISVDGTEKAHDKIRGKGNYKKTMDGIENLKSQKIVTRINSVIMKSNIDDIIDLAKQMHNNKQKIMIRRFIESGRGERLTNNVLSMQDYVYVNNQLKKELSEANYINGHYLRKKTERISERISIPFDITDGCKAGKRAIIITPEGNIHLCGFLAAQGFPPIGNTRKVHNWKKFWDDTNDKDYLEELKEKLYLYNKIPGIQQTNCIAYVQNYLNRGLL